MAITFFTNVHTFHVAKIPQIPISALVSFVEALEVGYSKHKNPYHNLVHAADVTQTVHYFLLKTGMVVGKPEGLKPTTCRTAFTCVCLCVCLFI